MLIGRALDRALKKVPLVPLQTPLCRAVDAATLYGFHANTPYEPRPLYDLGPASRGGRFTPKGGAPALYLADDLAISLHDYLGIDAHARLRPGTPAIVLFTVQVRLSAVLDLTEPAVRAALQTTLAELRAPWRFRRARSRPPTHTLGAAVHRAGHIQAICFPSTKGKGTCVCVLTESVTAPDFVRIHDPSSKLVATIP